MKVQKEGRGANGDSSTTKKKIFWCGIFPIIASFLRKGRTRLVREPRIDDTDQTIC